MIRLTLEQIIELHNDIVAQSGGSQGIRDINLIDSAINAPFQTFGGIDLYPTIEEKAARLAYNLTMSHAFIDGNKRIGAGVLALFLEVNNVELLATDEEIIDLFLSLASGEADYEKLHTWIKTHTPSRCKNSN